MSDIRKAIMERLGAVADGEKAVFAAPGIVVKEDAQYIYYYPEEDDRATFADEDGKGAYTVKSNRTGKPVSAKTYRSWDEAVSASNAMNEKLPPLKKRKASMSSPGAKAKMARWEESHAEGWGDLSKTLTATINGTRWTIVVDASTGKGQLMRSTGRGPQVVKEGAVDQLKRYAETARASRPGAKAEMMRMDDATRKHLRAWIVKWFRDVDDMVEAEQKIEKVYESDPEFYADAGWPKAARDAGLRGFSRPGVKAEFDKSAALAIVGKAVSSVPAGPQRDALQKALIDYYDNTQASNRLLQQGKLTDATRFDVEAGRAVQIAIRVWDRMGKPAAELRGYTQNLERAAEFSRPGAKVTAAKPDETEREDVKAGLKLMEKADQAVSDKIRTLIKEGKPQDQAVAIALDMKRRGEL